MKKYFAINIGRQIGSGGRAVAKIISEKLQINVYDKKLLKSASDHTGFNQECFEKADEVKDLKENTAKQKTIY